MKTTADILETWARETPQAVAISFEGRDVTYSALDARADGVAAALLAAGVQRGDRVAFVDRNCVEHFEVLFACGKIGAVFVPINWRLHPDETAWILDNCDARFVFVGAELASLLTACLGDRPRVVLGESGDYDRFLLEPTDLVPGDREPSAVTLLMYTSGTTGLPKGVMLTHENICGAADTAADWGFGADSTALVCMPLFHMSGTSWGLVAMYRGSSTVLLRDPAPAAILDAIAGHSVTHLLLVPAVISLVLADPRFSAMDVSSLRLLVYGGSPISHELLSQGMASLGCDFLQLYGLTESTGMATLLEPKDHVAVGPRTRLLRSVGRPSPQLELRVVDPETGRGCPTGEVGEIWLRGANVMAGYWGQPEATAEALRDGWLRTGDAGYLDEEGYVFLHDRVKDMIVSGGENVYPAEAERVLRQHPDVVEVCVVGIPDAKWGETPKAFVILAPGSATTVSTLLEFVRDRLAHYKCPTSLEIVADLPRNATGKVLKRVLREPYWAGHQRRVN